MLLITGAAASGKRTYAKSLGYAAEDMLDAGAEGLGVQAIAQDARPVVFDVQNAVLAACKAGEEFDLEAFADVLAAKDVVIACEVGSGVIPADAAYTKAREQAGRLAILLGQRAESVVRMVCGIPTMLKAPESASKAPEGASEARLGR